MPICIYLYVWMSAGTIVVMRMFRHCCCWISFIFMQAFLLNVLGSMSNFKRLPGCEAWVEIAAELEMWHAQGWYRTRTKPRYSESHKTHPF